MSRAAANAEVRKANVQDDSQFAFAQTRMHGEAELAEDLAVLEKARASRPLSALEASRLDDMIVRARGYQLAFRLFKAASDPENRDGIAAAARALIDYRIANRDAMMDHYEQVMNSRTKGTEGHRECAAEPCQGGVQKVICNSFAMRSWSFRSDV